MITSLNMVNKFHNVNKVYIVHKLNKFKVVIMIAIMEMMFIAYIWSIKSDFTFLIFGPGAEILAISSSDDRLNLTPQSFKQRNGHILAPRP